MRIHVNAPLAVSLGAILLAAIVVIGRVPSLFGAVFVGRPGDDPSRSTLGEFLEEHDADVSTYLARFNGRSLFATPKPPPKPTEPVVVRTRPEPAPPAREIVPRVPAVYTGPSVLFVLGSEVWFHNGLRIAVGQEDGGVKVLDTNPPWSVKLGFAGGEYDVEIFPHKDPFAGVSAPTVRRLEGLDVVEAPEPTVPERPLRN